VSGSLRVSYKKSSIADCEQIDKLSRVILKGSKAIALDPFSSKIMRSFIFPHTGRVMKKIESPVILGVSILVGCLLSPLGFATEEYTAPRTEWGQPDLQGVWNFSSSIPIERPSHFVEPEFGLVPALQEGVELQFGTRGAEKTAERPARHLARGIGADGPEDRGLSERCLVGFNAGPPFTPSVYNYFRIKTQQ